MNHIYRLIFDRQHGVWKVASELARGQGKAAGRLKRRAVVNREVHRKQDFSASTLFASRVPPRLRATLLTSVLTCAVSSPGFAQICTESPCTGTTVFDATTMDAVSGDWIFQDDSQLNASGAYAIVSPTVDFLDRSILNASSENAIYGGTLNFRGSSTLNSSVEFAIAGGRQNFYDDSTLNASTAGATGQGWQTFFNNSTLNASASDAISFWTQEFRDGSTLNALAGNAISGGAQNFHNDSILNAAVSNAIAGGWQSFSDNSTLNVLAANAAGGGWQRFYDNSMLNALAADALNDGWQSFFDNSTLNASVANAISGGAQNFSGESTLNASAANAVSGGEQFFSSISATNVSLSASTANAISGGTQVFFAGGVLYASATNAVNGGAQFLYSDSTLRVGADNALTTNVDLSFDTTFGDEGGTLDLNGYSTFVGRITSLSDGSGNIVNNGAANAVLTVDGTQLGDSLFSGVMANGNGGGTLGLRKEGEGALTLTGVNTYTGSTMVSGGTLRVDGSIASSSMLTVAAGATLGGSGTVGASRIDSGAILAPGSVGTTLTVDGDLTIASGATYQVYADPSAAQNTRVDITGTALLQGGGVMHVGPAGKYLPGIGYTILTADQGVTGRFADVQSHYAFLTPDLTYAPNTVTLELVRSMRFADAAYTPNQRATAGALESLGRSNDLYQRIETLPVGAPSAAFDNLSGEVHASVKTALRDADAGMRALTFKHLRSNLSAISYPGSPMAQAGNNDGSSLPQDGALPVWAETVGAWQTRDDDGNAARATQRNGGLIVGADQSVGNGWRVGGALGYTDSTLRVDDRNSKSQVNSYSATLYGGKAFEAGVGEFNLLMGAAYSWHTIDSQRRIDVAGLNQSLKADYHAGAAQLFTELGYAVAAGNAVLEPFAGVAWSDLRARGFSESGGSAALSGRAQNDDQTTTTVGVRAKTPFSLGKTSGTVRGSVGWRHTFGGLAPQSTHAFNGSQPFTVAGAPSARDTALLELGADIAVSRNATLGVSYAGQFGKGSRENTGSVSMRWRF